MYFLKNTSEEKRFFKLLKAAYVDARYNPHFVVTKEDIDALYTKGGNASKYYNADL